MLIDGCLQFGEFVTEFFGPLGFGEVLGVQLGRVGLVFTVHVGQDLFADQLEESNQEAARTAGRVTNDVAFLGFHHADHELNDGAGREELTDFAPKRPAQKSFKGDAFYVFARVRKVVALQEADDFAPVAGLTLMRSSSAKMRSSWNASFVR